MLDYDLQRVEGLLLRHLNSVYKVLGQTVPDGFKSDEVQEMELYLREMLRHVDSSLVDEWERMRDPDYSPLQATGTAARGMGMKPPGADEALRDVTRDTKAFTSAIRTSIFTFLRAWAIDNHAAAVAALQSMSAPSAEPVEAVAPDADGMPERPGAPDAATDVVASDRAASAWTIERLRDLAAGYRHEHDRLRLDPEARNARHTYAAPAEDGQTWRVQQMLVDPEMHNDWVAEFRVDIAASREAERPVLTLVHLGPLA